MYHLFIIRTKNRNELKNYLGSKGIETKIHYPNPIHKLKASSNLVFDLPKTEEYAKTILSLPIHSGLSKKNLDKIVTTINEFQK